MIVNRESRRGCGIENTFLVVYIDDGMIKDL